MKNNLFFFILLVLLVCICFVVCQNTQMTTALLEQRNSTLVENYLPQAEQIKQAELRIPIDFKIGQQEQRV